MSAQAIQHQPIVVVTRPEPKATGFAASLRALGFRVLKAPAIGIEHLKLGAPLRLNSILVFSSQNAVQSAMEQADLNGHSGYCVGKETADMLTAAGFHVRATAPDARTLLQVITADRPTDPVVYLRGHHVSLDIVSSLQNVGINASSQVVYDQRELPLADALGRSLEGDEPHIFPLFSPRTAKLVSRQLANIRCRAPIHLVTLSHAVDMAWEGPAPASRCHAVKPDAARMMDRIRQCIADLT